MNSNEDSIEYMSAYVRINDLLPSATETDKVKKGRGGSVPGNQPKVDLSHLKAATRLYR